ncbi:MAG: Signal peptidase I [Candidatus Levybacteria bacterium GW2011_GWA2_37_36]|nr:MAG: Signal peptidase I [Candidatus Levybacteria bacterium GW2011_GWA1_37_16]KKQ32062.1 MAG: Signal peptidase I [Candidatus Levybacteria bacterium GW2011_GWA2_37_36]KKQ38718.1 MAG: Signal peptidase I [Candidatus Levybacteria bacterium GW2011_GWC2_37_7]KKQ42651.1 MAG: Signal peptidase I [Candidatus Levybacteria bacterium GW2011_GWB1_37_8]
MEFLRKIYNFLLDTVQTLLIVFIVFLVIWQFLVRPFQVSGNSMQPTFLDKEYILTNIIALRFSQPKQGDVVVFKAPNDPEKDYIKRIIGVPGDQIMILNGDVYVNGAILDQSAYLKPTVKTYGGSFLREDIPVTVLTDSYFVMGDNRSGSSDSREWGFLPARNLIGKSSFVYWPLDKMEMIKNPYN